MVDRPVSQVVVPSPLPPRQKPDCAGYGVLHRRAHIGWAGSSVGGHIGSSCERMAPTAAPCAQCPPGHWRCDWQVQIMRVTSLPTTGPEVAKLVRLVNELVGGVLLEAAQNSEPDAVTVAANYRTLVWMSTCHNTRHGQWPRWRSVLTWSSLGGLVCQC